MPFYGVHRGRTTGVFTNWATVKELVTNYPKPKFKKFKTREEAQAYAETGKILEKPVEMDEKIYTLNYGDVMIFTDGSYSSKTKKTSIGIAFSGGFHPYNHNELLPPNTTNQFAELYAIAKALEILKGISQIHDGNEIEIWTDSDYSVKSIYHWSESWERNGWMTSGGKPVKYQEVIKYIKHHLEIYKDQKRRIKVRHIKEVGLKSHQSKPMDDKLLENMIWEGNKVADELARSLTI